MKDLDPTDLAGIIADRVWYQFTARETQDLRVCRQHATARAESPAKLPLCVDLYCRLGGWAEGFLAERYDGVGFDIEWHRYPKIVRRETSLKLEGNNGGAGQKI